MEFFKTGLGLASLLCIIPIVLHGSLLLEKWLEKSKKPAESNKEVTPVIIENSMKLPEA